MRHFKQQSVLGVKKNFQIKKFPLLCNVLTYLYVIYLNIPLKIVLFDDKD
jgi:hypothetical protein